MTVEKTADVNVYLTKDEALLIAKEAAQQAAQQAGQQAASQIAQQQAQQVAQAVSEAVSKVMQSQTATTGATTISRNIEDIGETERFAAENVDRSGIVFANQKRTYDEYQDIGLVGARDKGAFANKVLNDIAAHDNRVRVLAEEIIANSLNNSNLVNKNAISQQDALNKQHAAHRDIATDSSWNPIQQGAADTMTVRAVSLDDAALKAIGAIVANAMAGTVTPK